MASNLQELRKEAGYKSAKEFAAAIDIPVSTYSRYEAQPDSIPITAAWKIADFLNTSIDLVVGRKDVEIADMRGAVQKFYDDLTESGKKLFKEFAGYVQYRDEKLKEKIKAAEDERYRQFAKHYERMFYSSFEDTEFGDVAFSDPEKLRVEYEKFIEKKAEAKREEDLFELEQCYYCDPSYHGCDEVVDDDGNTYIVQVSNPTEEEVQQEINRDIDKKREEYEKRDAEVIAKIMEAYDKLHDDKSFEYMLVEF